MDELISTKKQFTKIGWFFVIATVVIYITEFLFSKGIQSFFPQWMNNVNVLMILSEICMYLTGFPLMAVFMKKYVPAEKPQRHKMTAGQYVVAAIMCFGLAYAANFLGVLLTMLISAFTGKPVTNEMAELISQLHPALVFVLTVVVAPILEEIFFRKMIVDRTIRYGEGLAIVTSGLLFGLFHGNLNQFVYAFVIGMFLSFLYIRTGNLKIPISLHMLFNFFGGFVSSLLVDMVDLNEYADLMEKNDLAGLMDSLLNHLGGWVLYFALLLFEFCILVAGIVLFIVFLSKKKLRLLEKEVRIPRQLKYSIAFGNLGMVVYIVFWTVMILYRLLG